MNKQEEPTSLAQALQLARQGNFKEAGALALSACQAQGNNPAAWLLLGKIQGNLGELDNAIDSFTMAARLAPGVVDGEHWDGVDALFAKYEGRPLGEKKRLVGEAVPIGRMARADDLVGMAVFLATREADYIVAQTYNVDGGNWMS